VVREVIEDASRASESKVAAGDALAVEENVLGFQSPREVGFSDDSWMSPVYPCEQAIWRKGLDAGNLLCPPSQGKTFS
jgi:hypothetical protein